MIIGGGAKAYPLFLKGPIMEKKLEMEPWLPAHTHVTTASTLSYNFILHASIYIQNSFLFTIFKRTIVKLHPNIDFGEL